MRRGMAGLGGGGRAKTRQREGAEEPEDAAGRRASAGGWGRARRESAGSYLRQGLARPGLGRRDEAEMKEGDGDRRSCPPQREPAPWRRRRAEKGRGRAPHCACSEPAGSAGGRLEAFPNPSLRRVSRGSRPRPPSGPAPPLLPCLRPFCPIARPSAQGLILSCCGRSVSPPRWSVGSSDTHL